MSRYLRFVLLLMIGLLAACASSMSPVSTPDQRNAIFTPKVLELSKSASTTTAPVTGIAPTRYFMPTKTATSQKNLQGQCLSIANAIPSMADLKGILILSALGQDDRYFWDFTNGTRRNFPDTIYSISTSPDGNWMYSIEEMETQVVFKTVDGSKVRKYLKNENWFSSLPTWISNTSLAFNILGDPRGIPPVMVINPLTNEQKLLPSNYPHLEPYAGSGRIKEHFIYGSVAYDPTFKYVVYPKTIEAQHSIVLWDRDGQKALAELEDEGNFYHNPVWSLDGSKFYIAVEKQSIDEIFRVNLKGEVRQLTEFGKASSDFKIGAMSLSPDGKLLAFWKSAKRSGAIEQLAMINIETQKVIDYCVPATIDFGDRPIWSPDSRFIAVKDYYETNHVRAILIDTQENWAAEIDQVYPSGWLR